MLLWARGILGDLQEIEELYKSAKCLTELKAELDASVGNIRRADMMKVKH